MRTLSTTGKQELKANSQLFLLRRIVSRRCGCTLLILHDRLRRVPGCEKSERNGRHHKNNGAPGRHLGKQGGGSAGAKCRLAACATKSGSNIGALTVLQQHNNDQDHAYEDVKRSEKNNEHA